MLSCVCVCVWLCAGLQGISEQELGRHVEQVRELELQLTRQRRAGEEGREEVAAGLARLKLQLREREGQCATLEEKLALAYREVSKTLHRCKGHLKRSRMAQISAP